jgi:hypothetical protein
MPGTGWMSNSDGAWGLVRRHGTSKAMVRAHRTGRVITRSPTAAAVAGAGHTCCLCGSTAAGLVVAARMPLVRTVLVPTIAWVARRTVLVAAAAFLSLTARELENFPRIGNHRPCSSEEGATGSHPAAYDQGRFS